MSLFKKEYPATDEEYQANQIAVEKIMMESDNDAFPILPEHLKMYFFKGVYEKAERWVIRRSDGQLRLCKAVKFNFDYEGNPYSDIFYIDKSLKEHCAILGSTFWNKFDMKE